MFNLSADEFCLICKMAGVHCPVGCHAVGYHEPDDRSKHERSDRARFPSRSCSPSRSRSPSSPQTPKTPEARARGRRRSRSPPGAPARGRRRSPQGSARPTKRGKRSNEPDQPDQPDQPNQRAQRAQPALQPIKLQFTPSALDPSTKMTLFVDPSGWSSDKLGRLTPEYSGAPALTSADGSSLQPMTLAFNSSILTAPSQLVLQIKPEEWRINMLGAWERIPTTASASSSAPTAAPTPTPTQFVAMALENGRRRFQASGLDYHTVFDSSTNSPFTYNWEALDEVYHNHRRSGRTPFYYVVPGGVQEDAFYVITVNDLRTSVEAICNMKMKADVYAQMDVCDGNIKEGWQPIGDIV
jgi:hypothetical protein